MSHEPGRTGWVVSDRNDRVRDPRMRGHAHPELAVEVVDDLVDVRDRDADADRPTIDLVPEALRGRLEEAELYHEILEHNWAMNDAAGADVAIEVAAHDYVDTVLTGHTDERTILPLND